MAIIETSSIFTNLPVTTVPFRHRFVLRLTDSIPSLINVLPSLSSGKVEVKGKKKTKWTDNIYCQNVEDLYLYIYINRLFIESSIYSESGGNKFLFSTISQFFFFLSLSLSFFSDRDEASSRDRVNRTRRRITRIRLANEWPQFTDSLGEEEKGRRRRNARFRFSRARSTNRFWKVGNFKWAAFIGTPVLC